jgi:uncharacterized membrane protein YhaH (DUF805 family)
MLTAIKYNLTHLADFRGRDARSTFWFYVLFLVLVQIAISMAISIPMTGSMMGEAFNAVKSGANEAEMQRRIFSHVNTMMRVTIWTSAVTSLAMIGLLAASFTRRLHDSGKPGWIVIVVAVIQVLQVVQMLAFMDEMVNMTVLLQTGDVASARAIQQGMALRSLLGYIPIVILIVFGVWPSTPGDNKYGPPSSPA